VLLRVVLAAVPGLLALVATVVAVTALLGWPFGLLATVPFLLVVDHRATAAQRNRPPAVGPLGEVG